MKRRIPGEEEKNQEQIKDETLREDEVMVSFDVKSLFTNVLVDEALRVI